MRPLVFPFLTGAASISRRVQRTISIAFAIASAALAQVPGGGGQGGGRGGGGVIGGGGVVVPGGGGGITPIGSIPGGGAQSGARIVSDPGILIGTTSQASVALQSAGAAAANATFQWTISGGRITTDATRQTISFVAETPGTVTLNVLTTLNGVAQSASADVTVISPADAGTISVPATAVTGAAAATASVPAAQDGDRTFRWAVTGAGAAITTGQGTNSISFRPGSPGLLEITCFVNLQRLVTVPLRSFVVVTGDGPPVAVTINGGNGGGTYPAGSRLDVFAFPPPAGQVFDRWTGDIAALGQAALAPLLPRAVVTVPATPVTLTATYKAAPAWTPTVVTNFNPVTLTVGTNTTTVSTTLAFHIPPAAVGVVFLLHGTGGNANSWFTSPEQLTLARDLVAAGYGVAALNSVNRNTGAWSGAATLANNPDAANITAALNRFVNDGLLTATRPVFLLGFAGGADAAMRFGEMLATATPPRPVKGVVQFCATGGQTLPVTSHLPQFFALAANDDELGTAGNTLARDNSQLLAGRGVATAVMTNTVSPVHPDRFRILGVNSATFTTADAQAIWNAVKSAGFVDVNNYLKLMPGAEQLRAAVPASYQSRLPDIAAQLRVAYAAQEFYADADARVLNFLNNRVADSPVPPPGRLINLSTRAEIAFAGDTFTLGFNIDGPQKAALLIRGIGPALRRFGLDTALGAPRLELNQGGRVIAANAGWESGGAATAAELVAAAKSVGAFALVPGDRDAALLLTLDPGSYTATVQGVNGASGEVLAEVYDVSRNATRLTNLSTLGTVAEGDLVVPGLVIAGNNPRTLVVRAIGPGLTDFGLPGDAVLGDPRVTVLNAQGQTVTINNNWTQGGATGTAATLNAVFPAVGAFALKAANADAALVNAFAPGSYTLQAGAAPLPTGTQVPENFVAPNQSGRVLVEVYEVP